MSAKILYRVLRKLRILKRINITTTVNVNSIRINVPLLGEIGLENMSLSEAWMCDVLKALPMPHDGLFVDVGVNVGQTLIGLKGAYPSMAYLGFEPNPVCAHYTSVLIESNGWQGAEIIPIGINDVSRLIEIHHYTPDHADSSASIIPGFREPDSICRTTYAPCFAVTDLDFLFKKKIAMIKIDVEGAELEVIETFKDQIRIRKPYLLCEILPSYDAENLVRVARQEKIWAIFHDLGYLVYRIHRDKNNYFVGFRLIKEFGIYSEIDWCDYVFTPTPLKNHVI